MTANLWHAVGTLLSVALLTSGGGAHQAWRNGEQGYGVAQLQAELGVLGFSPGPLNGHLTERVWQSMDSYASTFGIHASQSLASQVSETLTEMGTVPQSARGPVIGAVQQDLTILGVYKGPISAHWSAAMAHAVMALQRQVGLPTTGALTATTLTTLAHLAAVSVTARHRWKYYAQPGDTLVTLAYAAHLSYPGFARANDAHGSELLAGQLVRWTTRPPSPRKRVKKPAHQARATPPPSPPPAHAAPSTGTDSGVLANLKPLADLVLVNPGTTQALALMAAEQTVANRIDVAVSGQWALMHPALIKELTVLGNGLAIDGYSVANLNSLPVWGVRQELSWSRNILTSETGTAPTFVFTLANPNAMVVAAASQTRLIPVAADDVVSGRKASATTMSLEQALLSHNEQTVAVSGPVNWTALFQYLGRHQFVFETLGQIWAGQ